MTTQPVQPMQPVQIPAVRPTATAAITTAMTVDGIRALLEMADLTSNRPREIRNLRVLFAAITPYLAHRTRARVWRDICRAHRALACLESPESSNGYATTGTVLHEAGEEATGDSYVDDQTAIDIAQGWLDNAIRAAARANTDAAGDRISQPRPLSRTRPVAATPIPEAAHPRSP